MGAINTVGVVGLGTMGAGIVEVFAKQGLATIAVEIDQSALDRGRAIVASSTQRAVDRGRMSEQDAKDLVDSISFTLEFSDLAAADLVIEAVPERMSIKKDLFSRLDAVCPPETIFATNTSSLSVTDIAATTSRPDRLIGMHFFNPAPVMKLVEVVRTVLTAQEVVSRISELARACGKSPVVVGDRAGFVVNTLLVSYLNDAVNVFDQSRVSREGIDTAMTVGALLPMGPLALCDLIGLDVCLEIMDVLFAQSRDQVHAPAPLMREMVSAGLLGRKSGRGFFTYEKPGSGRVIPDELTPADFEPVTLPRQVYLVGDGMQCEELVKLCAQAGVSSHVVSYDQFDPGQVPEGVPVLVSVKPVQRAIDIATQMGPRIDEVIGLHVLFPNQKGQLVEIAATPFSSDRLVRISQSIALGASASPVICDDDPGQVVGRLLSPYLNDAVRMVASGYVSADDVDTAMMLGCGYPRGPIAFLANFSTPGTICDVLEQISRKTQLSRHLPVSALTDAAIYGVGIDQLLTESS